MLDVLDYHSRIEHAAATATRLGVRTLVLTHLVPAPPADSPAEAAWAQQAAVGFAGEIIVARDLTAIDA